MVTIVGGATLAGTAWGLSFGTERTPEWSVPLMGIGAALTITGLVALPFAIALDVDSGAPRGAQLAISPRGISISGAF